VNQVSEKFGNYESNIETNKQETQEGTIYYFYSKFEKQKIDIEITFGSKNKIVGFFFTLHKHYNKKAEYEFGEEYDIVSDGIKLTGTLIIPKEKNQKILCIFIHGSGPEDRDETIYKNKPFKDLATGLMKYGIATFRFDKRTLIAPETLESDYTINDVTIRDVINIINHFRKNDTFKFYRIVLIGHSLGEMLIPKILLSHKSGIYGAIIMAGNARPLYEVLSEQIQYLYKLNPSERMKRKMEKMGKQIDYLKSKKFSLNTPRDSLPLNQPASYWKSLKDYNIKKIAKKINKPLLILQGEHDYQVTMKDFNLWKNALRGIQNVEFKSYPKLNHIFMETDDMATHANYRTKKK